MYKQILVPVDGSPTSEHATREAIGLAKDQQAAVRFLHVVDTVSYVPDAQFTPTDMKEINSAVRRYGEQTLNKALEAAGHAGVKADTRLVETTRAGQRISKLITDEAESWPADLIVIGTHGRRGLDHLLLGSVAENVVRTAVTPVLLVRGKDTGQ